MKRYLLVGMLLLVGGVLLGQNEEDALRYSNLDLQGSARYASMGGAFGALGVDLTVLSVNPAGMARIKSNHLAGTFNLAVEKTTTVLNGSNTEGTSEKLGINNFGVVGVIKTPTDNPSPWRKVQLGFSYNRLLDLNNITNLKGSNDASFSYVLADRGYGGTPDDIYVQDYYYSSLAYESYLTDYVLDSGISYYTTQMYGENITHNYTKETVGKVSENAFSISGNYLDKLYLGATIGLDKIRFSQTKTYFEQSNNDSLAIDNFTFIDYLTTTGKGYNLKLGAIVLPKKWLRLGLAVHTPTFYYNMKDEWYTSLRTVFKGDTVRGGTTRKADYTYKLTTPGRLIASVAYVNKKHGVLSLDCEYINYTKAVLKTHPNSGDNYSFDYENGLTQSLYQSAINIRLGAEYKITNQLMARLGYAVNMPPYTKDFIEKMTPKTKYSAGIGFRSAQFYIDLAYVYSVQTQNYYFYDPILIENSTPQIKTTNILLSLGVKI